MAYRPYQQLREDLWDFKYRSTLGEADNVLNFYKPEPRITARRRWIWCNRPPKRCVLPARRKRPRSENGIKPSMRSMANLWM